MDMVTTEQLFYFIGIMSWLWISILLFIGTFTIYVAIMKIREVKDRLWRLHWPVRWVCYLILAIGYVSDTMLNWIACSASYLELPKEILTTTRVSRHKNNPSGKWLFWEFEWLKNWRHKQSKYWCQHWLQPFDSAHCD